MRFYAMASIIVVIHKRPPGAAGLGFLLSPETLALLAFSALLYVAALVILEA